MVGLISQAVRIEHEIDPALQILEELGGLHEQLNVGGADVLVAVYKRIGRGGVEAKTKGGVFVPTRTADEDDYQGVSGLVLKLGPRAFCREHTERWFTVDGDLESPPRPPRAGDWVLFDIKIGFPFKLGGKTCRLIDDEHIMGILPDPDIVA